MKMPEVKLQDGNSFYHDDVKNKEVQSWLRKAYQSRGEGRPVCCCNDDIEKLELVIALKRKTGLFELRKMPGQSHELHSSKCFFSKPSVSVDKRVALSSFNILMPIKENDWFADHSAIDKLNNALHKFIREDIEIRNWLHMKIELIELGKTLVVNDAPLAWILNIINPRTKEYLSEIWFRENEPRLVFAEVLSARKIDERSSVMVKLKGCSDALWFSSSQIGNSISEKLLSNSEGKRVFILATVRKSVTGKSIQGHGISIRVLDKDFK